jgi:hypothetical protein
MGFEIDPKEFGAMQANLETLTQEIHLLRKEMVGINAAINQGRAVCMSCCWQLAQLDR